MYNKNLLKEVAVLKKKYEHLSQQTILAEKKEEKADRELDKGLRLLHKLLVSKIRILLRLYKIDDYSFYGPNLGLATLVSQKYINLRDYFTIYNIDGLVGNKEPNYFESFPVEWLFKSNEEIKQIIQTKNKKSLEMLNQKLKKIKTINKKQTILELKAEIVRLGGSV